MCSSDLSQVDLGNGKLKRRDQYIEAFKESFDAGCTLSGRRHIIQASAGTPASRTPARHNPHNLAPLPRPRY